jgi:hypothetical protein
MDQESRARFLDFAKFLDFDLVPDLDQSFAENDSCGLEAASLYAWVWAILDNINICRYVYQRPRGLLMKFFDMEEWEACQTQKNNSHRLVLPTVIANNRRRRVCTSLNPCTL